MNRKNYVSEHQKGVVKIDLCEDSSNDSCRDKWLDSEKRYTEVFNRHPEDHSKSKYMRTRSYVQRPATPPPPVISSQAGSSRVKTHFQRDGRGSENEYNTSHDNLDFPRSAPISLFKSGRSTDSRFRENLQNDLINFPSSSNSFNQNTFTYRNLYSLEERTVEKFKPSQKEKNQFRRPSEYATSLESKGLTLIIADKGPNRMRLGASNWRLVESALCTVYLNIMRENPGPPPACRAAGLFLGSAKVIECADERSLKLFSLALSRLGAVWPGAKLLIVDPNQISTNEIRLRAVASVPAEPSKNQAILECIQSSNPDLPTDDWTVISVGAPSRLNNQRQILISFGIESLEFIEERRQVINYGFGSITLKVIRRDQQRIQQHKNRNQNIHRHDERGVSTSRKRRWSEMEADKDDGISEYGSADDEGYK